MPRRKQETDLDSIKSAPVLSVLQVAAYMNVGRESVLKLLSSGRLKGARVGPDWRVLRTEVDRFLLGAGQTDDGGG